MILTLLLVPDAHAQRYLSEFVGTSRVTTASGVLAIDSNLTFTDQLNRSLGGNLVLQETDVLGNQETELFSVTATLAASGQCPAKLSNSTSSGSLQLDEFTFDANVFALYGRFDFSTDGGQVRVDSKRVTGPAAYLQPPADFLALASREGSLVLSGADGDETLDVAVDEVGRDGTARGVASSGRDIPYDLVLSSNSRWFYLLAVGTDSVVVGRGAVELDRAGLPAYASGSFSELSSEGKTLDEGRFSIDLR